MAKVTGPFMSLDASGTIYGCLTASIWKGRNYIRAYRVPTNPNSALQIAHRLVWVNGVAAWQGVTTVSQADWNAFGSTCIPTMSGFNAYMKTFIPGDTDPLALPDAPYIGKKGIHG